MKPQSPGRITESLSDTCFVGDCREVLKTVLDPFLGSGTAAEVAQRLGRGWIGIDLNPSYTPMQQRRTAQMALALGRLTAIEGG